MSLLSATLGRFVPRYRTLGEWAETYCDIVARRPIQAKTLANRRGYIKRIVDTLGDRRISAILPHEIGAVGVSIGGAVEACRSYGRGAAADDALLIRKSTGAAPAAASASWRFEEAREGGIGLHQGDGAPASLHELRSLCEREYRAVGVDTQTLLGHTRQEMTDLYNNGRGLDARLGTWRTLELPAANPEP